MTTTTAPYPHARCEMRDMTGYNLQVTHTPNHCGFTLIGDDLVPESFIQRVIYEHASTCFKYGEVLRMKDIFLPEFLDTLTVDECQVLMPVVLQLIARGDFPLHLQDAVGDDEATTRTK